MDVDLEEYRGMWKDNAEEVIGGQRHQCGGTRDRARDRSEKRMIVS